MRNSDTRKLKLALANVANEATQASDSNIKETNLTTQTITGIIRDCTALPRNLDMAMFRPPLTPF